MLVLFVTLIHADSVVAGKGILSSCIATGIFGFATTILFLFCTPDLDTLFALDAPQPFVQLYALALGKGGSIVMTIFAVVGLILVSSFYAYQSPQRSHSYPRVPVSRSSLHRV